MIPSNLVLFPVLVSCNLFSGFWRRAFIRHTLNSTFFFCSRVLFFGFSTYTKMRSAYILAMADHWKWAYLTIFFTLTPFIVNLIILIGAKTFMFIKRNEKKKIKEKNSFLLIFGHLLFVQNFRSSSI